VFTAIILSIGEETATPSAMDTILGVDFEVPTASDRWTPPDIPYIFSTLVPTLLYIFDSVNASLPLTGITPATGGDEEIELGSEC
jgi:hypothetical protein